MEKICFSDSHILLTQTFSSSGPFQQAGMLHVFAQWWVNRTFYQFIIACGSELENHWNADLGDEVLGGRRKYSANRIMHNCVLQYSTDYGRRLEVVGGEMMSIYRMKRSRRPGQPDFTPLPLLLTPPYYYYMVSAIIYLPPIFIHLLSNQRDQMSRIAWLYPYPSSSLLHTRV